MPTFELEDAILTELRAGTQPFTDKDVNGRVFTANTNGDWKKCLLFSEILEAMDRDDANKAWEKLRRVKSVHISDVPSYFP